jgi:hypothetical protein
MEPQVSNVEESLGDNFDSSIRYFTLYVAVSQRVLVSPIFVVSSSIAISNSAASTLRLTNAEVYDIVKTGFNRGSGGRVKFRSLLRAIDEFANLFNVEIVEDASEFSEVPSMDPSVVSSNTPSTTFFSDIPTLQASGSPTILATTIAPSSMPSNGATYLAPSDEPSMQPSMSITFPETKFPLYAPTTAPSVLTVKDDKLKSIITAAITGGSAAILLSCCLFAFCRFGRAGKTSRDNEADALGQQENVDSSSNDSGSTSTNEDECDYLPSLGNDSNFLSDVALLEDEIQDVPIGSYDDESMFPLLHDTVQKDFLHLGCAEPSTYMVDYDLLTFDQFAQVDLNKVPHMIQTNINPPQLDARASSSTETTHTGLSDASSDMWSIRTRAELEAAGVSMETIGKLSGDDTSTSPQHARSVPDSLRFRSSDSFDSFEDVWTTTSILMNESPLQKSEPNSIVVTDDSLSSHTPGNIDDTSPQQLSSVSMSPRMDDLLRTIVEDAWRMELVMKSSSRSSISPRSASSNVPVGALARRHSLAFIDQHRESRASSKKSRSVQSVPKCSDEHDVMQKITSSSFAQSTPHRTRFLDFGILGSPKHVEPRVLLHGVQYDQTSSLQDPTDKEVKPNFDTGDVRNTLIPSCTPDNEGNDRNQEAFEMLAANFVEDDNGLHTESQVYKGSSSESTTPTSSPGVLGISHESISQSLSSHLGAVTNAQDALHQRSLFRPISFSSTRSVSSAVSHTSTESRETTSSTRSLPLIGTGRNSMGYHASLSRLLVQRLTQKQNVSTSSRSTIDSLRITRSIIQASSLATEHQNATRRQVSVTMPPGNNGITLVAQHDGLGTVVAAVHSSSPLYGDLTRGDRISKWNLIHCTNWLF